MNRKNHEWKAFLVSVAVGLLVYLLADNAWTLLPKAIPSASQNIGLRSPFEDTVARMPFQKVWYVQLRLIIPTLAIAGALLTYRFMRNKQGVNETHCRHCDHILCGLSEPRCPECGNAI